MADDNFDEFIKKLEYLEEDIKKVGRQVVNRAINEGMAVTIKATPKGEYSADVFFMTRSGKQVHFKRKFVPQGGTLQKGWISTPAIMTSTGWKGEYSNNVEYGFWVNFGHRVVVDGETVGYVPGQFFLEAGVEHMKRNLDRYFASEIKNIRGNWK